tara:strand:- start:104 stop:376 length:273 start_codon:yes stop_codon:yes gene_type:complete
MPNHYTTEEEYIYFKSEKARTLKDLSFAKAALGRAIVNEDTKGIQTYENMVSVRQDEYDKVINGISLISSPFSSVLIFGENLTPTLGFSI